MLKDATRRPFDVLMVWSIDRLGRSTRAVVNALADLEASGVAIYADKEAVDATTPHGRAMLQMAAVFAELKRGMIRERVMAGLERARKAGKALGRQKLSKGVEAAVRARLTAGDGILKAARSCGRRHQRGSTDQGRHGAMERRQRPCCAGKKSQESARLVDTVDRGRAVMQGATHPGRLPPCVS